MLFKVLETNPFHLTESGCKFSVSELHCWPEWQDFRCLMIYFPFNFLSMVGKVMWNRGQYLILRWIRKALETNPVRATNWLHSPLNYMQVISFYSARVSTWTRSPQEKGVSWWLGVGKGAGEEYTPLLRKEKKKVKTTVKYFHMAWWERERRKKRKAHSFLSTFGCRCLCARTAF